MSYWGGEDYQDAHRKTEYGLGLRGCAFYVLYVVFVFLCIMFGLWLWGGK